MHKRMSWTSAWYVIGEFVAKRMSEVQACQWLDIARARLYQLRKKWLKQQEAKGVPDFLYQRPDPPSRLAPEVHSFLEDEIRYLKEESKEFKDDINFGFLAQRCHQRFNKRFHRNTLRRWAIERGLYKPDEDKRRKPTKRFQTGGIGILYQHDSSHHLWLPKTGRMDTLILTIDDHSRKATGARLVPNDTAWNHLCVARQSIETFGCPLAYYTDNAQMFSPETDIHGQFDRALRSLEITLKLTPKARPQAKGKIERMFSTFQSRIPLLCEKYNVTSLTEANRILDEEVVHYYNEYHEHSETGETPNKRWKRALEEGRVYLREVPKDKSLDLIFGLHYDRVVKNDGTIRFGGQMFRLPEAPRGATVTVVLRPPTGPKHPHTEISVLHKGSTLLHVVLPSRSRPGATDETSGPS